MRQGSRKAFAWHCIKGAIPGDLKFQGFKATACCKSKSSLWFSPEARACFYCSHHPPKNSDTSTSCLVQALAGEVVMGLFLEITLWWVSSLTFKVVGAQLTPNGGDVFLLWKRSSSLTHYLAGEAVAFWLPLLNDSGSISDLLGNLLLTIIPNNILAYWTTSKPNLAVQIIDNCSPIMPPWCPKF